MTTRTILWMLAALPLAAQNKTLTCEGDHSYNRDQVTSCEVREQSMPVSGRVTVDGLTNGGISVKSWNQASVLVRAKVQTYAPTDAEAKALGAQVIIHSTGGMVSAAGPSSGHWYVSYEIFVPAQTDLNLTTHNGGISIADIHGTLEFQTHNGGVHLSRVGGTVHGSTHNGGVHVELAGQQWDGTGLDVETYNGGVNLEVPTGYSAHLQASTRNGGVRSEIPNLVLDRRSKEVNANIGSGGAVLHIVTSNGGVHVRTKGPVVI
jgi:DUF4097 and DUF4098 domain-containing protein YvlB